MRNMNLQKPLLGTIVCFACLVLLSVLPLGSAAIAQDVNKLMDAVDTDKAMESVDTDKMKEAVKELPVKIIQSTSDEGKGLLSHVKKGLGAHHSPDIFHVQHEIVKGTTGPLAKKTQKAQQALEKASENVNRCIDKKVNYDSKKPMPGRPP